MSYTDVDIYRYMTYTDIARRCKATRTIPSLSALLCVLHGGTKWDIEKRREDSWRKRRERESGVEERFIQIKSDE
jgi:hypothetical protein